jgi:hypothetical protein
VGVRLARQLELYASEQQQEFIKEYGRPLPEDEIFEAAAAYLLKKAEERRKGSQPSGRSSNGH